MRSALEIVHASSEILFQEKLGKQKSDWMFAVGEILLKGFEKQSTFSSKVA